MSQPLKEIQNIKEECNSTPSTTSSLSTKSLFGSSQSYCGAENVGNIVTSSNFNSNTTSPSVSPILQVTWNSEINAEGREPGTSVDLTLNSTDTIQNDEDETSGSLSTNGGLETSETLPTSSSSESSSAANDNCLDSSLSYGDLTEKKQNQEETDENGENQEEGAAVADPAFSSCDVSFHEQQGNSGAVDSTTDTNFIDPLSVAVAVLASQALGGNVYCLQSEESGKTPKLKNCDLCNFKTMSNSDLEDHKVSAHGFDSPPRAFCHDCSVQFCTNRQFRTHRIRTHEPMALRCTHCCKVYVRQEHFVRHLEMHLTQATCHNCGHVYCSPCSFRQHETTQKHQRNMANNTI